MRLPLCASTSLALATATLLACGGSSPPAATPEASSAAPASSAPAVTGSSTPTDDPPEPQALPAKCDGPSTPACVPPADFVERLCARPHQELALALFGKTPFSRLYLKGKMDELAFGEEVLALHFHAQAKGGMQVGSGNGSYDVLRWDGSCSRAVDADILGTSSPGHPKTARVLWHRIGDKTQTALIAGNEAIKAAHKRRGKECGGTMTGDVSAACQKADAALGDAIVDYVRSGGAIPAPDAP